MKKLQLLLIPLAFLLTNSGCENKNNTGQNAPVKQGESYIEFTSDPPGAQVEIAIEIDGDNFKPGTGRQIGATPVKTVLTEEDINNNAMVNFIMTYGGRTTIGQVKVDKHPIVEKTYTFHQKY